MEVSLKEFADRYNTVKTRREKKMSEGYIYRLIRQAEGKPKAGKLTRDLWFKYKFEGNKDAIRIIISD